MNENDKDFLVQKIRTQYTEKEHTQLDALKDLDKKVKRPANVFAYMHDFEISDDITMNIEPAVISPYNAYAYNAPTYGTGHNALGMKVGLRF